MTDWWVALLLGFLTVTWLMNLNLNRKLWKRLLLLEKLAKMTYVTDEVEILSPTSPTTTNK